ncbi:hypothetical protein MCOR21_002896 [Pyricularia oryzae]|uniref:Uncharacterized protein n=1 Tax=Pyricularia oryzae TaxID=318829 RepID=A0A4V1C8B8_PYROR|nr:hypothetical protein MCOR34_010414 [Pyricularia oryzae]KAI6433279.1 hypothetical protein MCOR21_002896 [Pyricularia oryzae]KAI6505113.1 hypothetical protein MCOR13_004444 [Pyricularia oryzae]QBZ66338.1 hypothetical protein PoMZ_13312 [Pyricularia oryzae]
MLAKVALLLLPLLASAAATPVPPKAGIVARGDRKWEFLDTRKGKNPLYTIGEERTKSPPKAELIRTHGVRSGGSSRDPSALHDNDWNDPDAYNAANDRTLMLTITATGIRDSTHKFGLSYLPRHSALGLIQAP